MAISGAALGQIWPKGPAVGKQDFKETEWILIHHRPEEIITSFKLNIFTTFKGFSVSFVQQMVLFKLPLSLWATVIIHAKC